MNKELQSFESYLEDLFMNDFTGTKDQCEDAFSAWLEYKGTGEIMELAEVWGDLQIKISQKTLIDSLHTEAVKFFEKH